MNESSCCSTFLSAFGGVVSVPDFGHSNRYVVAFCCFNVYFPDDVMWSISHVLICHLSIFSGKILLNFKFFTYFESQSSIRYCFLQIFFHSVAFLFIPLILSFAEQIFLFLMKSTLLLLL